MTHLSSTTPTAVWVLAAVQVALLVTALVAWARTPRDRFTGNRWAWLAALLLLSVIGPLAFLFFGRRPPTVDHTPTTPEGSTQAVTEMLYGDKP